MFRAAPHGVIFVERAQHLRDHPGQIGLPGGSVHPGDADLEATALRELREEVGVEERRVTIVGRLPMLRQQRANNFDVTPFVAVVDDGELTIDGTETAGVFLVPLADVLTADWRTEPGLEREGRRIWGLTARILSEFVARWHGELRERAAAVIGRSL